jgi:hypothetical protein
MQFADFARMICGRDGNIAGTAQQLLQQSDIRRLIVNNQDIGFKNV